MSAEGGKVSGDAAAAGRSAARAAGGAGAAGAESFDIRNRIEIAEASLTPQELRAADFIVAHLDELATYSATEIAFRSEVSKATVSRLFRRLGYSDAAEWREAARQSLARSARVTRDARDGGVPVGASADLAAHLLAEHAGLEAMLRGLGDGRLEAAVALLAGAREVVVVGFRNSYPVALHLRQQLSQARGGVRLAPQPGQSIGEELADLDRRDAVVLVGFRRRPAGFARLAAAIRERRIGLVTLTDAGRPATDSATDVHLTVPVASAGPFDSYAAAMSLVAVLSAGILSALGPAAAERVADVTGLYGELGELER